MTFAKLRSFRRLISLIAYCTSIAYTTSFLCPWKDYCRLFLMNKNAAIGTTIAAAAAPTTTAGRYGKDAEDTDGTDHILKSGSQSRKSIVCMHPTVTISTIPSLSTSPVPTFHAETDSPTIQSLLCFNVKVLPFQLHTLSSARDLSSAFTAKLPYPVVQPLVTISFLPSPSTSLIEIDVGSVMSRFSHSWLFSRFKTPPLQFQILSCPSTFVPSYVNPLVTISGTSSSSTSATFTCLAIVLP